MSLSIGIFTYSTKPRGSVVHAAALAEALCAAGQRATLYALHKDGAGFYRPLSCELCLVEAGAAPAATDELIRQRIAELSHYLNAARVRHDLFHAQDCLTANALLELPACAGRVVRTVHHVEAFTSPYLGECQVRSIERADLLLSVSQHTARVVWQGFSRTARVVGNGVAVDRFVRADARGTLALRQELMGEGAGPLLLSVGGVEPRKNTLALLEAFAGVLPSYPEARWVIAGGASVLDHSEYYARFSQRLQQSPALRRAVRLTGVLSEAELTQAYLAADGLLAASIQEGFGLSILEAMAAGVPVLAPQGPPFDEFLDPSCAVLVDARDTGAITHGLLRLLADPWSRQREARTRALGLSWSNVAKRHRESYAAFLRSAPQPARPPPLHNSMN